MATQAPLFTTALLQPSAAVVDASTMAALRNSVRPKNRLKAMIGSAMFNSSSLASDAIETVTSLPMI